MNWLAQNWMWVAVVIGVAWSLRFLRRELALEHARGIHQRFEAAPRARASKEAGHPVHAPCSPALSPSPKGDESWP